MFIKNIIEFWKTFFAVRKALRIERKLDGLPIDEIIFKNIKSANIIHPSIEEYKLNNGMMSIENIPSSIPLNKSELNGIVKMIRPAPPFVQEIKTRIEHLQNQLNEIEETFGEFDDK